MQSNLQSLYERSQNCLDLAKTKFTPLNLRAYYHPYVKGRGEIENHPGGGGGEKDSRYMLWSSDLFASMLYDDLVQTNLDIICLQGICLRVLHTGFADICD